jgi:hypothetical protein
MTDKELYQLVRNELFKNGSCDHDKWYLIKLDNSGKTGVFEAKINNRGFIHIRKPFKKRNNGVGETILIYNVYRFTGQQELKYSHMEEVHETEIKRIYEEYKQRTITV